MPCQSSFGVRFPHYHEYWSRNALMRGTPQPVVLCPAREDILRQRRRVHPLLVLLRCSVERLIQQVERGRVRSCGFLLIYGRAVSGGYGRSARSTQWRGRWKASRPLTRQLSTYPRASPFARDLRPYGNNGITFLFLRRRTTFLSCSKHSSSFGMIVARPTALASSWPR